MPKEARGIHAFQRAPFHASASLQVLAASCHVLQKGCYFAGSSQSQK